MSRRDRPHRSGSGNRASHECAWIATTEAFEVHGHGTSGSLPFSARQGSPTGHSEVKNEEMRRFGGWGVWGTRVVVGVVLMMGWSPGITSSMRHPPSPWELRRQTIEVAPLMSNRRGEATETAVRGKIEAQQKETPGPLISSRHLTAGTDLSLRVDEISEAVLCDHNTLCEINARTGGAADCRILQDSQAVVAKTPKRGISTLSVQSWRKIQCCGMHE